MRRTRQQAAIWGLTAACSIGVASFAGTAIPAGAASPAGVCGLPSGSADAVYSDEVRTLGAEHACEHLNARKSGTTAKGHTGPTTADATTTATAGARTADASATTATATTTTTTTAAVTAAAVDDPAVSGSWSTAVNPGTKTIAITSVLLHTGKVLMFGGKYRSTDKNTAAYVYDPVTRTGHEVPAPAAVYCGGITVLADGRVLSVGGADPVPLGIVDVYLFDPITERWIRQPDTPRARYYPTTTKLGDGRVVIVAGDMLDGNPNPDVEVYTPPAPGGSVGTMAVVGKPHPSTFYPHQWVLPNGTMLKVATRNVHTLDPATWTWTARAPMSRVRTGGKSALMLPAGPSGSNRFLVAGGQDAKVSTNTTERYDAVTNTWLAGKAMPNPRAHMNLVQVPDGSAYGVGGNGYNYYEQPQLQTLHYAPATDTWTPMATQAPRRAYHSTAVLLPDGRIMSAGDTGAGGGRQAVDFYSPPYLFAPNRPTISSAPTQVNFGSTFAIGTPASGTRAVLMAAGATTHTNEMHARHVELAVTDTAAGLTATAPTSNVAPPGYYMLFVLDSRGVPSVAKWVHVGPGL